MANAPSPRDLLVPTELDERLVQAFGDRVFTIGGRVRDAYIAHYHGGLVPGKDHDYVLVGVPFEEAQEKLSAIGRVDLVGASFGVFKLDGCDIALARTERNTGWGHRDVAAHFTPDVTIEDDARRRDITINTLSVRLSDMRLIAPLRGALDDIRDRRIEAISQETFADDPLRMLRCVQFASRFGFHLTDRTRDMILCQAPRIAHITAERIAVELDKLLLRSPQPSVGMQLLRDTGLTTHILPELLEGRGHTQNAFHQHTIEGHLFATLDATARSGGDLEDRWAALLHDIGKPRTAAPREDGKGYTFYNHERIGADMAREILGRLRYSDDFIRRTAALVDNHMYAIHSNVSTPLSDASIRRFIRRTTFDGKDLDLIEKQFRLRAADIAGSGRPDMVNLAAEEAFEQRVREERERQPAITVSHLHLRGQDVIGAIIETGLRPATYRGDRLVGETLQTLLDAVIEKPELNTPPRLRRRLRAHLDEELRREVTSVIHATEDHYERKRLTGHFQQIEIGRHVTGTVVAATPIVYSIDLGNGNYTCQLSAKTGITPQVGQTVHLERERQDRYHAHIVNVRQREEERHIA